MPLRLATATARRVCVCILTISPIFSLIHTAVRTPAHSPLARPSTFGNRRCNPNVPSKRRTCTYTRRSLAVPPTTPRGGATSSVLRCAQHSTRANASLPRFSVASAYPPISAISVHFYAPSSWRPLNAPDNPHPHAYAPISACLPRSTCRRWNHHHHHPSLLPSADRAPEIVPPIPLGVRRSITKFTLTQPPSPLRGAATFIAYKPTRACLSRRHMLLLAPFSRSLLSAAPNRIIIPLVVA